MRLEMVSIFIVPVAINIVVQLLVSFNDKLSYLKASNYTMTIGKYLIHCLDSYMGLVLLGNCISMFDGE